MVNFEKWFNSSFNALYTRHFIFKKCRHFVVINMTSFLRHFYVISKVNIT